jgi:hypothetical protein
MFIQDFLVGGYKTVRIRKNSVRNPKQKTIQVQARRS